LLSYALDLLEASDLKDLIVVSARTSISLPLARAVVPQRERGLVWLMWAWFRWWRGRRRRGSSVPGSPAHTWIDFVWR